MRVHLIDGTFELFRAHFSKLPDHLGPGGEPRKAVVGLVGSLLGLLHDPDEAPSHLAVAFDRPIESFRNDLFEGYKTGEGVDPDLTAQFQPAEDAVRALGLTVWSMDRWEADDALATGAARFRDQVEQVRLLTPDKDLGQCLSGNRVVQVDRIRKKRIDEAAFRARRGIAPESLPDFLALVGDSADGIPGIPGFGEKTAGLLLAAFPHLEDVPALGLRWPSEIRGAKRLAPVLAERREEAQLYRQLATLVTDVPLAETLDDLAWGGIPQEAFEAWCARWGVTRFRNRRLRWAA